MWKNGYLSEKIVDYYKATGKLPKTSGSTPEDFMKVFDQIHAEYPEAQILYLAYSAVTICSYQSSVIASEDRDYVTAMDTRQVSIGQGNVVVAAGFWEFIHASRFWKGSWWLRRSTVER